MKQKEAEEKLKAKEEEYRSLIDQATDGIFISNEKGKYLDANLSACQMLGYSKEELLHLSIHDILLQEEAKNNPPRFDELRAGKTLLSTRNLRRKDGSTIPVEITAKMLSNGNLLGMVRDITERKEAEKKINKLNEELELKVIERTAQLESNIRQLKESEEKFQKAFQASAAGITITRLSDSTYQDVNDTFIEMTGYPEAELINHSSSELGIIVNFNKRDEILQQVREHGSAKTFEMTVRHKSGRMLEVIASIETILLNGEKYAIHIIYDVTERKKTEEQLKKTNELFFNLFEHNPASIVISRLNDAKIINVNEAFLSSFGFSNKEEVFDKTARELNIVAQPEQREELAQLLKQNQIVKDFEIKAFTKQGKVFWISTSILVTEFDGTPCLFSISIDVSNRKKMEEQLREVNKEMEAFSYSVSHDLRAPLRSVIGYSKILEEDFNENLNEDGKRILKIVRQNASKMNNLIDDMLKFSKLSKKELQKSEIDTGDLIRNILSEINSSIQHKADVKLSNLLSIRADSTLLTQVWINLISNAIKYSAKKEYPTIEIGSHKEEDAIVFYIKDNGAGFDMAYVDKLFGVFQRLHQYSEFEGTGVGLALVHRIIAKHDGRIWAEGKVDEGATFYFSLPNNGVAKDLQ